MGKKKSPPAATEPKPKGRRKTKGKGKRPQRPQRPVILQREEDGKWVDFEDCHGSRRAKRVALDQMKSATYRTLTIGEPFNVKIERRKVAVIDKGR